MKPRLVQWSPAVLLVIASSTHTLAAEGAFPPSINLASLDGNNGFVLNGIDPWDIAGSSVSSAGDVNGDGIDDLIIGAEWAAPHGKEFAGESYIVFGGPDVGSTTGVIELSSLDGANGFVINGIDAGDTSGGPVASAGDINNDGFDDVIIGATGGDPGGISSAGESYVVFGAIEVGATGLFELSSLDGANGFVLEGIDPEDFSGDSVASAGDLNGDGVDDVVIGAFGADPLGMEFAGETYVVFGRNVTIEGPFPASLPLASLDGANGFILAGTNVDDVSGASVSSAGDVNNDGVDDLFIGTRFAGAIGRSYVVFGRNTSEEGLFPAWMPLSSLNGSNGFVINGIDSGDHSGISVSSAGDVNGDGIEDLITGAPYADPSGQISAGECYVIFGAVGIGASGSLDLSTLAGSIGFVINGINPDNVTGFSVSSAGDVNRDGISDLVIGAHRADPNGQSNAGESYVVFGAVGIGASGSLELSALDGTNGFALNGIDPEDFTGWSVSSAGDVNDDGVDDIIVGAARADPNGRINANESYVVFGRSCSGDIDRDGDTDVFDFGILATFFGQTVAPNTSGDLDNDGFVTVFDFSIFAGDFGCPQ